MASFYKSDVIVTTTPSVEGYVIVKYYKLISAKSFQDKDYIGAIENELKQKAYDIGANAVIGVSINMEGRDFSTYYQGVGTAVFIKTPEQIEEDKKEQLLKQQAELKRELELKEWIVNKETRISDAKSKAEANPGKFYYSAYEDRYSSFNTAKELVAFLEGLNITDEYFTKDVLPLLKVIEAQESNGSNQVSTALGTLKRLTENNQ